jgi:hypothetical protein
MHGEMSYFFKRLALLPKKVARHGPGWAVRRLYETSTSIADRIFYIAVRQYAVLLPFLDGFSRRTLVVYYDLAIYPISYDICWFLALADLERRRNGRRYLHCIFIPIEDHDNRKLPPGYGDVVDLKSRNWRFHNICVPMTSLVPECDGFTVCNTRTQFKPLRLLSPKAWPTNNHPHGYPPPSVLYRDLIGRIKEDNLDWGLKAQEQGLRYVRKWLADRAGGRKPIVVTLRQYAVDIDRNSNIAAWVEFLRRLDQTKYFPILVPDTDHAMELNESFSGLQQFIEGAWNLGLRMALYEAAYLNMFVNCGPASLCILNPRTRYLLFKITVSGIHLASEETLREMGFEPGETPPIATAHQRWVWEDDRLEVITREFEAMVSKVEAEGSLAIGSAAINK